MVCRPGDKEEKNKVVAVHVCMPDSRVRVDLSTARSLEIHKAFGVMAHASLTWENPFYTSMTQIKHLFE